MAGFTKLFSSIVTSSIWCKDDKTLRIWIAMLASCDANGIVEGSIPGFANLARVSVEEMECTIQILTAPDPYSRTPDHQGRRLEPVPGGWRILNYQAYRDRGQAKEGSRAPYMRQRREAARARLDEPRCNTLHPSGACDTEAEEEEEEEEEVERNPKHHQPPTKRVKRPSDLSLCPILNKEAQEAFDRIWSLWPTTRRDGKPAKGDRIPGERVFQAILDTGEVQTPELEAAARLYLDHHPNVRAGYIQMVSTFFGPEKRLWAEAVRTLRARAAEASSTPE